MVRPGWRLERLWELAPAGPASRRLRRECRQYVGSHYWPDVPLGTVVKGYRSEDVERPTFDDGSFDVIVSADVLEHVVDVDTAQAQIARVLAEGGAHVWTTPQHQDLEASRPRVRRGRGGELERLEPAEYHGDPVSRAGALVTFDWGRDLPERVASASGMWTESIRLESRAHGLLGDFLEVFVSHRGAVDGGLRDVRTSTRTSPERAQQPSRARLPNLASYRSWWVTERLRELRATIWRSRDRRRR